MAREHFALTRTNRRRFLTGAGKFGALLLGAAYDPIASGTASAEAGQGGQGNPGAPPTDTDEEDQPVEEKGIVRVLGIVQRRPGLTRLQVKFRSPGFDFSEADRALMAGTNAAGFNATDLQTRRPTAIGPYYSWVYGQVTKNDPGRTTRHIHNVVLDSAFGDGQVCTALNNRDLVTELSFQREGAKPTTAARQQPTPPDMLESTTALNMAVQQIQAHGTRQVIALGGEKVMHYLKVLSTAGDPVQAWQRLHARAVAATPGFMDGLRGDELLRRLPNTVGLQPVRCGGAEVPVPDLVAVFWAKKPDGGAAWQNYVRAFRQADTEKAFEPAACFFLVVQEFRYT
jgi:hypothetical protein